MRPVFPAFILGSIWSPRENSADVGSPFYMDKISLIPMSSSFFVLAAKKFTLKVLTHPVAIVPGPLPPNS